MDIYKQCSELEQIVKETGYKTINSLMFLYWLVKNIQPNYILELGTGLGCSSIFMALGSKKTSITSIDDYKQDFSNNNIRKVTKNLEKCNVLRQITLIEMNTVLFSQMLIENNRCVEVVFMDASHNKNDLWLEYNAFKNSLLDDHIIIIDDYYSKYKKEGVNNIGNYTSDFVAELSEYYQGCFVLKFHNGMAVLITSLGKHLEPLTQAIWRANHA